MTNATKWTPGPWVQWKRPRDGRWFGTADKKIIGAILGDRNDPLTEADANMAAAAPDLYEALEWALETVEGTFACFNVTPEKDGALVRCRAALAKARGEVVAS